MYCTVGSMIISYVHTHVQYSTVQYSSCAVPIWCFKRIIQRIFFTYLYCMKEEHIRSILVKFWIQFLQYTCGIHQVFILHWNCHSLHHTVVYSRWTYLHTDWMFVFLLYLSHWKRLLQLTKDTFLHKLLNLEYFLTAKQTFMHQISNSRINQQVEEHLPENRYDRPPTGIQLPVPIQ